MKLLLEDAYTRTDELSDAVEELEQKEEQIKESYEKLIQNLKLEKEKEDNEKEMNLEIFKL